MNTKGKYIIKKLFQAYYSHPQQLPNGQILHILVDCRDEVKNVYISRKKEFEDGVYDNIDKAKEVGIGRARTDFEMLMENPNVYAKMCLMRRICDHIASMTDRYAIEEYTKLYE